MSEQKYQRLSQTLSDSSDEQFLGHDEHLSWMEAQTKTLARTWKLVHVLAVLLVGFIVSNVVLWAKLQQARNDPDGQSLLGLKRNIPVAIPWDHRTLDDPVWDSPEFDIDQGWLALDDSFAKAKGLPTAMYWPWDHSKGIYLAHGFHSMHCVLLLRDVIIRYRDGKDQLWAMEHITHCLHVLREDTVCDADDTMRYTGHLHALENATVITSGIGQIRMCRDWNKLRQFAAENSACYARPADRYVPLLDRYKNCPDGSKPWEGQEE